MELRAQWISVKPAFTTWLPPPHVLLVLQTVTHAQKRELIQRYAPSVQQCLEPRKTQHVMRAPQPTATHVHQVAQPAQIVAQAITKPRMALVPLVP